METGTMIPVSLVVGAGGPMSAAIVALFWALMREKSKHKSTVVNYSKMLMEKDAEIKKLYDTFIKKMEDMDRKSSELIADGIQTRILNTQALSNLSEHVKHGNAIMVKLIDKL